MWIKEGIHFMGDIIMDLMHGWTYRGPGGGGYEMGKRNQLIIKG